MKIIGLKRLVIGLCVVLFFSGVMADTIYIPITTEEGASSWCWAASSKALCSYYDKNFNKTLTQVASVYTTNKNKCPPLDSLSILLPIIVEKGGDAINMKTVFRSGKLSWQEYKKEIDEKRLFIFVIKWDVAGVYHCNVATGYDGDSNSLYYMDPGNQDKRWRSWKEITGVNTILSGNTKKGTWFGSLLVLPPTPIANESGQDNNFVPFTIVTDYRKHNKSSIALRFNEQVSSSASLKIFNMQGACMYTTDVSCGCNSDFFQIPYQFSAGNYVISFSQDSPAVLKNRENRMFSIVK